MKNTITLIFLSLLLTNCAINRKIQYAGLNMNLSNVKQNKIAFALLDHREQVIDGSRKPDFVGYMRSNVGIAYPMGTESKNNFIDDLSKNVASSFNRFNIESTVIKTTWEDSEEDVKNQLFDTSNEKKILIVFNELHTDGYAIQVLHLDIDVFIYGNDNKLLAFKQFDETRKLGGTVAWGAGPYKRYMPEAVTKLFEDIFNNEDILSAINSTP